jgi:hypothetical protein
MAGQNCIFQMIRNRYDQRRRPRDIQTIFQITGKGATKDITRL